jgi:hypothetical protein
MMAIERDPCTECHVKFSSEEDAMQFISEASHPLLSRSPNTAAIMIEAVSIVGEPSFCARSFSSISEFMQAIEGAGEHADARLVREHLVQFPGYLCCYLRHDLGSTLCSLVPVFAEPKNKVH